MIERGCPLFAVIYVVRKATDLLDAASSNTRQLGCVFQDMEPPKLSSI